MTMPNQTSILRAHANRVRVASRLICRGETNSRRFDNCFEMYDGDQVVAALARRAESNPLDWELRARLPRLFPKLQETTQKYAGLSDPELAREARRQVWQGMAESEQHLMEAWQDDLIVYKVILPYGGTFAVSARNGDACFLLEQMSLYGIHCAEIQTDHQPAALAQEPVLPGAHGAAILLRTLTARLGGTLTGHVLPTQELAAGLTFNSQVDTAIQEAKRATSRKAFGDPDLFTAVRQYASCLNL